MVLVIVVIVVMMEYQELVQFACTHESHIEAKLNESKKICPYIGGVGNSNLWMI
jgi:hypothetical protein